MIGRRPAGLLGHPRSPVPACDAAHLDEQPPVSSVGAISVAVPVAAADPSAV